MLNQDGLKFYWSQQGSLELLTSGAVGGKRKNVTAVSCFPWSHPQEYVSVVDEKGEELVLIESLETLSEGSRQALKRALEQAGFVLQIKAIDSVEEESDLRVWKVQTQVGPRQFVTKLDDWPQAFEDGRVLMTDVAGDLFEVKEIESMDSKSQKLLWPLVDFD